MAAKMAGRKPSITIPGTTSAAKYKTTALITKINSPKVIKVMGKVRKSRIGLIKVLMTAKTIAAKMAVVKLLISKPGTI
jgi:hypothetical protein